MPQFHRRAPGVLYKFRADFDRDVRALLVDRTLYLSSPLKLNDPFDCFPSVRIPPPDRLADCVEATAASLPPHRRADARHRADLLVSSASHRRAFQAEHHREDLSRYGICSLSATKENALLWAHYGAQFGGFVVGYRGRNCSKGEAFPAVPVKYVNERPTTSPLEEDSNDVMGVFFSKSPDWSHEQEWRYVRPPEEGGPGVMAVPAGCIVEVILGPRIRKQDAAAVLAAVRELEDQPVVLQAQLLDDVYGMDFVEHPAGRHSNGG